MSLREALPVNYVAWFVVDIVAELDLAHIYERYGLRGGEAYAPESFCWPCYSTGMPPACSAPVRSKRLPTKRYLFRFVAGGLHPDHDTLANFRKTFRAEIKDLFVQVLLLAQAAGYLKLGNISMDGSKVHANASKSKAVSYKRLLALEGRLRAEVDQLFRLAEQGIDGHEVPAGMNVTDEIVLRQERLARLAEAKQVLQAWGQERQAAEQAEYEAKQRDGSQSPAHRPQAARFADTAGVRTASQVNTTLPILSHAS